MIKALKNRKAEGYIDVAIAVLVRLRFLRARDMTSSVGQHLRLPQVQAIQQEERIREQEPVRTRTPSRAPSR